MKIELISCSAPRPDRRAIAKSFTEYAVHMDHALAMELTEILLDGTAVDLELHDNTSNSALRIFRKLSIDYEFVE
ncbi:MAG: hypothetical protein KJP00_15805 [Bacteroidia bacterium]|nr:hypothetical protein [Bacteroidia bacterium]